MTTYRIKSLTRHWTASVTVADGRVIDAAPVVKYMLGWKVSAVRKHAVDKGFVIERMR